MSVQAGGSQKQSKLGQKKENKTRPGASALMPVLIVHKDVYHRLNFMYQASILLEALGAEEKPKEIGKGSSSTGVSNGRDLDSQRAETGKRVVNCSELAKAAMKSTFKTVAVHQTLRLDSSLKRSVCRSCGTVLIPGMTSSTRIRPSKNFKQVIHTTCLSCTSVTSLPAPPLQSTQHETNTAGKSLDGPVRSKRRRNAQRNVPFNDREAVDGGKGHELWSAGGKISCWGCSSLNETKDGAAESSSVCQQREVEGGSENEDRQKRKHAVKRKSAAVSAAMDDEEAMMNS